MLAVHDLNPSTLPININTEQLYLTEQKDYIVKHRDTIEHEMDQKHNFKALLEMIFFEVHKPEKRQGQLTIRAHRATDAKLVSTRLGPQQAYCMRQQ